jgi:hypothetical protein
MKEISLPAYPNAEKHRLFLNGSIIYALSKKRASMAIPTVGV